MIYILQKLKIGYKNIDMYKLYQFANEYIVPIMKYKQGFLTIVVIVIVLIVTAGTCFFIIFSN